MERWLVGCFGAATSPGMSHLSISSDSSSVAWTPSASEMGDAAFVGTPTVFASHQDVTTLFSSIDGVSVATLEGAIADLRSDERSDVSVVGRVDGVRGTREAAGPTLYSLQRALASPPSG